MRLNRLIPLFFLALLLAACQPLAAPAPAPAETASPAPALLIVQVDPPGSEVVIDGESRGTSPLSLRLPPGTHEVVVRSTTFGSMTQTLTLEAGQEATYAPVIGETQPPEVTLDADRVEVGWNEPVAVRAEAVDDTGIASLEVLFGETVLATDEDGELALELVPSELPGAEPGKSYTLLARAVDDVGNTAEATLVLRFAAPEAATTPVSPTATAQGRAAEATPVSQPTLPAIAEAGTPLPEPTPVEEVKYDVLQLSIPTYPYWPFVKSVADAEVGGYPAPVLNRSAYEGSGMKPADRSYKLLVLENRYLRLEILPDLGGRIYRAIFKPTGHNELYANPVIKPTQWGPPVPPHPEGVNWWLGAGGIEWGFPVEEHGYEWGMAWGYDHVRLANGGVMITLFSRTGPKAPYAVVDVILPPDTAYFVVQPRIVNPQGAPFRFKWWANAMLAPGAANKPSQDLRFIWPAAEVTVHSRGDSEMPGPGSVIPWPVSSGRDFGRLGNWSSYMGIFQAPAAGGGFAGVYDPTADEGMVRVYPPEVARGAKFFAHGWQNALDPGLWTDDGSAYVEMQGGLMPTYDDWYELAPGDEVTWSEIWYPVAGIGGVTHAGENGALHLTRLESGLQVAFFPTLPVKGTIRIVAGGGTPVDRAVEIAPDHPFVETLALPAGDVTFTLTDETGDEVYTFKGAVGTP